MRSSFGIHINAQGISSIDVELGGGARNRLGDALHPKHSRPVTLGVSPEARERSVAQTPSNTTASALATQ